jgi:hypothetical protein
MRPQALQAHTQALQRTDTTTHSHLLPPRTRATAHACAHAQPLMRPPSPTHNTQPPAATTHMRSCTRMSTCTTAEAPTSAACAHTQAPHTTHRHLLPPHMQAPAQTHTQAHIQAKRNLCCAHQALHSSIKRYSQQTDTGCRHTHTCAAAERPDPAHMRDCKHTRLRTCTYATAGARAPTQLHTHADGQMHTRTRAIANARAHAPTHIRNCKRTCTHAHMQLPLRQPSAHGQMSHAPTAT